MKITLMILAALIIGFFLGLILCRGTIKRLRRRVRILRTNGEEPEEKKKTETTKKVIWVCLFNGLAWVWCSYIFAYLDKVQIAESLSQVAVTEIIGVVLAYCIKSAIENLSKNNHWPDKTPAIPPATEPEECAGPEPERDGPQDFSQ